MLKGLIVKELIVKEFDGMDNTFEPKIPIDPN